MLRVARHRHAADRLSQTFVEPVEVLLVGESARSLDQDRVHPELRPRANRLCQRAEPIHIETERVSWSDPPSIVNVWRGIIGGRSPVLRTRRYCAEKRDTQQTSEQ